MNKPIKIPISAGELIDKITILELKLSKVKDTGRKKLIIREAEFLNKEFDRIISNERQKLSQLNVLKDNLLKINKKLWITEDRIRELEMKKDFGEQFIKLAREVYLTNDKRFKIKNKIDNFLNSTIKEVKEYKGYI